MVNSLITMEDIVTRFSGRLEITKDEQKGIFVDKLEVLALKSNKVFLVCKVLTQKSVNKDNFKWQMRKL